MKNLALQFLIVLIFISSGKGQSNDYVNKIQRQIDKLFPSKFKVESKLDEVGNSIKISEIGNRDIFWYSSGSHKNYTLSDLSYSHKLAKTSAKIGRILIPILNEKGILNVEVGADDLIIKILCHQDYNSEIKKTIGAIVESINLFQQTYPQKYRNFQISFWDSSSPAKGVNGIIEFSYVSTIIDPNFEFCYTRIYDLKIPLSEEIFFNNFSIVPSPYGDQYVKIVSNCFEKANIFLSKVHRNEISGKNVFLMDEAKISRDYRKIHLKILISPYSEPQTVAYIGYLTCDFDVETKQLDNFILKMNKKG
jgi:hypothetical protein